MHAQRRPHTSCSTEERCEPTSLDADTGHFQITLTTTSKVNIEQDGYDYSQMDVLRFSELPYAAESLTVTMRLRIDSAQAATKGFFDDGRAFVEAYAAAAHHELPCYECQDETSAVIVDAEATRGPSSRDLSMVLLPPSGKVMPPGRIAFAFSLLGWLTHSDPELVATGIPRDELRLDATLEGITVELDAAPWP